MRAFVVLAHVCVRSFFIFFEFFFWGTRSSLENWIKIIEVSGRKEGWRERGIGGSEVLVRIRVYVCVFSTCIMYCSHVCIVDSECMGGCLGMEHCSVTGFWQG